MIAVVNDDPQKLKVSSERPQKLKVSSEGVTFNLRTVRGPGLCLGLG